MGDRVDNLRLHRNTLMKTYEALSMLYAARDGQIPTKRSAVKQYGERSLAILKELGMKEEEINSQYPDDMLKDGLFLVTNHPTEWSRQAKASASWLISRN